MSGYGSKGRAHACEESQAGETDTETVVVSRGGSGDVDLSSPAAGGGLTTRTTRSAMPRFDRRPQVSS